MIGGPGAPPTPWVHVRNGGVLMIPILAQHLTMLKLARPCSFSLWLRPDRPRSEAPELPPTAGGDRAEPQIGRGYGVSGEAKAAIAMTFSTPMSPMPPVYTPPRPPEV